MSRSLTPRQERFCEEYLADCNADAAARRAGYSASQARRASVDLLGKPQVQARVAELMRARSERTQITAERVLEELWGIATADPRELVEYRVTCCRHCYGEGFRYQRTQLERDAAYQAWLQRTKKKRGEAFDEQGGVGYDPRRDPNPACQNCFGEGVGKPVLKDTRTLAAEARRLYAGIKETRDGLEVKLHDKTAALTLIGKHLGLFKEKVEHTGKDGGPIEVDVTDVRARIAGRLARLAPRG